MTTLFPSRYVICVPFYSHLDYSLYYNQQSIAAYRSGLAININRDRQQIASAFDTYKSELSKGNKVRRKEFHCAEYMNVLRANEE